MRDQSVITIHVSKDIDIETLEALGQMMLAVERMVMKMDNEFEKDMDEKEIERWNNSDFPPMPPLDVGNVVYMKMSANHPNIRPNKDRLMRVTEIRKAISQSGWIVDVKINPDNPNPIVDTSGNPCYELLDMDTSWFIKY
mgnify:CR=1 FL=1